MPKIKSEYHIISNSDDGWMIKEPGSPQKGFKFKTKNEAINEAKILADKNKATIVIHKKDGTIEENKKIEAEDKNEKSKISDKINRTFGSANGKVHMAEDFDETYEY